jgi:hypothetical protein
MLGGVSLDQLGRTGPQDPRFTQAHDVFARGGAVPGPALAHVSNTVNPSRIIACLPDVLAEAEPDTVAAAYLSAMRHEAGRAFAAGNQPGYLTVRAFSAEPAEAELPRSQSHTRMRARKLHEHALRLDGCTTTLRRPARAPAA